MAGVTPEVEVLHASPVNPSRLRPPPLLYCRTCSPKETDATLRKEQVQIVYEIVCIVFGEDRFRPSLPELLGGIFAMAHSNLNPSEGERG
jgi:hypothetical protein